jgi:hypothetical protein
MTIKSEPAGESIPQTNATKSFAAGCISGVVGCIVGHPLDTIKLFQQTNKDSLSIIAVGYRKLLIERKGTAAIWRGLGPALAVQVITSSFLFGTQTSISHRVTENLGKWQWLAVGISSEEVIDSKYRLQQAMSISTVTCATISGFFTGGLLAPIVCPLEGFKCRSQVATGSTMANLTGQLNWKRLYSGFVPSVLRCSFGNAAFFGVYAVCQSAGVNAAIGGACAGAAFWVAGMPFDVLKSRMQTADLHSAVPTMRETYFKIRQEVGLRGLYAGLPVTLIRAVPMNAAVLLTYEFVLHRI